MKEAIAMQSTQPLRAIHLVRPIAVVQTQSAHMQTAPTKVVQMQRAHMQAAPTKLSRGHRGDIACAQLLREQCRRLCLSLFFRTSAPVRSLGFTSALSGEGKSLLSLMTAQVLAEDSSTPVTLLDCNWEHPNVQQYYDFPPLPGLAEWVRGECSEAAIRYRVSRNLTVIPAGDSKQNTVRLLQHIRQEGLLTMLCRSNGLLIVDLPAILTTGYGTLAASLVEALILVVRAGVTPDLQVTETYTQMKDLPIRGVMLNQLESHIPRWIRQFL